jgi:hypothetical protein
MKSSLVEAVEQNRTTIALARFHEATSSSVWPISLKKRMPMSTVSHPSGSPRAKVKPPQVGRTHEENLDPDDWDEVRRLGHRMLDDMMDYLSSVRERPVKYGRLIEQNIDQARYLAALIKKNKSLQLLAPVELNIVCFRHNPGIYGERDLDRMNEILIRIQESGVSVPSGTRVSGRFAIRVAVTNHRSTRSDFRLLMDQVLKLGSGLQAEGHEPSPNL